MKAFIDELSKILYYNYRDLIEVDLLLYKILSEFSQNEFFYKNFLLKGGTCLIKNYLDYYRFSEDLDFTWKAQNIFKNKSGKELRRDLSKLINKISKIIEEICKKFNLKFRNDKTNGDYFEFGGSNKLVTFKLHFNSEILEYEKYIKIQINFVECLKFEPKIGKLRTIIPKNNELNFLFPNEYRALSKEIKFPIYNIKEILCEKVRAILTRKGTFLKKRDYYDIFLILNKYQFNIKNFKNQIIEKTLFTLNLYDKYKENLKEKERLIDSGGLYTREDDEEERLLLKKIDNKKFQAFIDEFNIFLKEIKNYIFEKIPNFNI